MICTMHHALCTMHHALTMRHVPCTPYAPYAMNHAHNALYTPCTSYTPCTIHHALCTIQLLPRALPPLDSALRRWVQVVRHEGSVHSKRTIQPTALHEHAAAVYVHQGSCTYRTSCTRTYRTSCTRTYRTSCTRTYSTSCTRTYSTSGARGTTGTRSTLSDVLFQSLIDFGYARLVGCGRGKRHDAKQERQEMQRGREREIGTEMSAS
jgi:hypothetical protein